jgi:chromosome segregation ATPase
MEHMTREVKTVTEQYGGLTKQTAEMQNDVKELKEDMAIVKPVIQQNSKDIQGLKKDTKEIKSELHSVKMAIMTVSHEVGGHDKRIKKVEEKVVV